MLGGLPRSAADGRIDYSADFFGKPAFLTVSGQLNGKRLLLLLKSIVFFSLLDFWKKREKKLKPQKKKRT